VDRIQRIQVYGERCSGTTYLESLISKNIRSAPIRWDFGWKHFYVQGSVERAADCLFIVIHRNPFRWLSSLHRTPWHAAPELRGIAFSEFIRRDWWCIWDEDSGKSRDDPLYGTEMLVERCPDTHRRFPNVIRMRTAKIRSWESLRTRARNTIYVRYEDLVGDPRAFVDAACERFGLIRSRFFRNVRTDRRYGWHRRWRRRWRPTAYDPIKHDDLVYILGQLNIDLEEGIGYDVKRLAVEEGAPR
jgi:hypothetical protein